MAPSLWKWINNNFMSRTIQLSPVSYTKSIYSLPRHLLFKAAALASCLLSLQPRNFVKNIFLILSLQSQQDAKQMDAHCLKSLSACRFLRLSLWDLKRFVYHVKLVNKLVSLPTYTGKHSSGIFTRVGFKITLLKWVTNLTKTPLFKIIESFSIKQTCKVLKKLSN